MAFSKDNHLKFCGMVPDIMPYYKLYDVKSLKSGKFDGYQLKWSQEMFAFQEVYSLNT